MIDRYLNLTELVGKPILFSQVPIELLGSRVIDMNDLASMAGQVAQLCKIQYVNFHCFKAASNSAAELMLSRLEGSS